MYIKCDRKINIPAMRLSFTTGNEVYEVTEKQYKKLSRFRYIKEATKTEFEKNKGKFKEVKLDVNNKKTKSFKEIKKGD